ncbi:MAG: hypothetical protein KGJ06_09360 [Pseudomonadota bacterium]|nr:hypothetical protein [Pseudomonadota bacterium]
MAAPPENSPYLPKMIEAEGGHAPEAPATLKATGIDRTDLLDLALKTAHLLPQLSTESAATRMRLPRALAAELLEQLRGDMLLEALGQENPFSTRYAISQRGRERADRLMEVSGYVGPAPVSLDAYRAMLEWQDAHTPHVSPETVKTVLAGLVLTDEATEIAGLAISSGRSLFLSGPAGNGKTSLGRQLHRALSGDLWIPYCIAVDSNIIRLFDEHCHEEVPVAAEKHHPIDQRWIKVKRPFVVAGGEMTLASLDLAYLEAQRYYEAPLHMKANGGTFLIDDFGRQHVEPHELLNRWIIPLENKIDFLTLHSGQKIEVPFLLMLIIATNLDPKDVTDPAFLRRLGYRLKLEAPSAELYSRIFIQYAAQYDLKVPPEILARLLKRYADTGRELRACEPRDLIERVGDICKLRGIPPALTDEFLDLAWRGYFGDEQNAA